MTILVTGAAGFIGMHVARALLDRGDPVLGVDRLGPAPDPALARARLARLEGRPGFRFRRLDIADRDAMERLAREEAGIDRIVHLAALPGVRRSLEDPHGYVTANVTGHLCVLELARGIGPRLAHLVYASSSSVYGANPSLPFRETDDASRPVSIYAATKRADELMSECYRHLFGIPQTGLRFFTVYGPWGRPDMAVYGFARAIARGEPIRLYEGGALRRDFTFIDDIVAGVLGVLDRPPDADAPARLLNIGNRRAERVDELVRLLERGLGRTAIVEAAPAPGTDVSATFASIEAIAALTGYAPRVDLAEGVRRFLDWFRAYEGIPDRA